jgi:Rrf2 family protein
MFSKTTEYALRATIYIAEKGTIDHKLGIEEISRAIDSPRPFTAKILQLLSKGGVISSVKGPNGGFYISEKLKKQPVWNILVALDEDERLTNCVMGLDKCSDKKPCPMHEQYKVIKEQLIDLFKKKRILEVAEAMEKEDIFNRCILGLHTCSETNPCPMHAEFKNIRGQLNNLFQKKTIQNLADKMKETNIFINNAKAKSLK